MLVSLHGPLLWVVRSEARRRAYQCMGAPESRPDRTAIYKVLFDADVRYGPSPSLKGYRETETQWSSRTKDLAVCGAWADDFVELLASVIASAY